MADKITMVRCIIRQHEHATRLEHKPRIEINGQTIDYQFDVAQTIPQAVADVARDAGLVVTILPDEDETSLPIIEGDDDAAVSEAPGGDAGGGASPDEFDAGAIIAGTVDEVAERLTGLTLEQLDKVAAAEAERDQPRSGVIQSVAKARKAFAPDD